MTRVRAVIHHRLPPLAVGVAVVMLQSCSGCGTLAWDDSPETPTGTVSAGPNTAGLTLGLGGDASALYAVTANAGVWRSMPDRDVPQRGGPWVQLPQSPAKAYVIAIDPNDAKHLAVGEREGDALGIPTNHVGAWESRDQGSTWPDSLYFNPLSHPPCAQQAVLAVAFSQKSSLLIATACGIGVKASGAKTFVFPALPRGVTTVTAFAVAETKLWARTASGTLLVSTTDGAQWVLATAKPLPPGIVFGARGDPTSLGAFDNWAFMSTVGADNGAGNNFSQLLIYDVGRDQWIVQPRIENALNGTGAGGRRLLRSLVSGNGGRIGSDLQLFFCNAQEAYRATGQNQDGTLTWIAVAATAASGVNVPQPQFANRLHTDIWDVLPTRDGQHLWVATDGGVYEDASTTPGWTLRIYGLHTQHIHNLFAPAPQDLHFAYPTHDNDAWFRTAPGTWDHEGSLGDVNWTAGDEGSPSVGLLVRRTGPCPAGLCTLLTGFGANLANGAPLWGITLSNDATFTDPTFFRFIQTLNDETPPVGSLDAVMLARLPLKVVDANGALVNAPGHLGNPAKDGTEDLVLLRNSQFATSPDINTSKGAGWQVAANNLPSGTLGFAVAGGHRAPVYYVFAIQAGQPKLFKDTGPAPPQVTQWQELNVMGNVLQAPPFPPSGMLIGGLEGPLFVNPYDQSQVYVLTSNGVRVSADGGFSFNSEPALTALITGGGKFPLVASFPGAQSSAGDLNLNYLSIRIGTLTNVAWNRLKPTELVAGSPFTGVFYATGNGQWKDLTSYLPTPRAPISMVTIDNYAIHITTEGRGLLRLSDFR